MQRPDETGFVLITALWLLLLCSAVVALAMARSAGRAEAVQNKASELQTQLDLDATFETIAADLIIKGPSSHWAQLPGNGEISVNGQSVKISLSSDGGRLDLNSGDITIIDRALQGLKVSGARRAMFREAIEDRRARDKPFANLSDAASTSALVGSSPCSDRWFTLYSGLSQPDQEQMSEELAHALGQPRRSGFEYQPMKPGTPLRVLLVHPGGASLEAIVRFGGIESAYDTLNWTRCVKN